jgi:predicted nucleic acid-binding protein
MSLSCLTDPSLPIYADASTLINLNASGCASAVLKALPNKVRVLDTVMAELRRDKRTGRDDAKLARALVNEGLLEVMPLASLKSDHFENLVAGPAAETLDDGEAAIIAGALEGSGIALIDERKAIALCGRKHPTLTIASTVDVLAHTAVEKAMGRAALGDGVFDALQNARMRVSTHHERWIVDIVGSERAKSCVSLSSRLRATLL